MSKKPILLDLTRPQARELERHVRLELMLRLRAAPLLVRGLKKLQAALEEAQR